MNTFNQNNTFGDNNIYQINTNQDRELSGDNKEDIVSQLKKLDVLSVMIRFEHNGETAEFVEKIANFLITSGYSVRAQPVTQSEIKRNEFSIIKHPSDPSFAIIRIGTQ